jgi:osmotically-inducible protein OsmY
VHLALKSAAGLDISKLFVRAHNGAVTVSGAVPDRSQYGQAERIVNGVSDVKPVSNKLVSSSRSTATQPDPSDTAPEFTSPYTSDAAFQYWQDLAVNHPDEFAARFKDGSLRVIVLRRLAEGPVIIDKTNVHVTVRDGVVTLYGYVPERSQINAAEKIAKSVEGIKSVKNKLRVSTHDDH